MKIGIVASAGGAVIFEIYPYLLDCGINIVIVTDRACGIEERCIKNNVIYKRFDFIDSITFSKQAADFFKNNGVKELVFLYNLRFVSKELYEVYNTLNFHPSLLPLFSGLNPINKQKAAKPSLLGATVHKVNHSCDGGLIIGQIANSYTTTNIDRISFLQKVFLTLSVIDNVLFIPDEQICRFLNTNMAISKKTFNFFTSIQNKFEQKIV